MMLKSTVLVSGLALAAAATTLAATPARADITDFFVYHSQSYTQNSSGLSGPVLGVETTTITGVNGSSMAAR